ncbi:unnamed protein product [Prorocentrum cordatum]|uniref:Uncharacterized protein n=1 Tax=Prorocentrum cordatum TaxID=2364126 RepID=A0ABN9Y7Y5_9DINO|nr:unnamed protein product [Polarella glacialis]
MLEGASLLAQVGCPDSLAAPEQLLLLLGLCWPPLLLFLSENRQRHKYRCSKGPRGLLRSALAGLPSPHAWRSLQRRSCSARSAGEEVWGGVRRRPVITQGLANASMCDICLLSYPSPSYM